MSENDPKRPAGHAVTIFQFVTILLCAATLIIVVRVHDKVARIPKTPADTTPVRHKDKGALSRQPARSKSPTDAAKDAATSAAKDASKDSTNNANDTGQSATRDGDDDSNSAARRSPIPEPGEVITKPFDYQMPSAAALQAPPVEPGQVIPWDQAHRYVGQEITVEGKIVAATIHNPQRGGDICFLNFTNEPRGGDRFYLIMWQDLFNAFPQRPDQHFEGKIVRATGRIDLYAQRPQMKIRKKEQIQIVD